MDPLEGSYCNEFLIVQKFDDLIITAKRIKTLPGGSKNSEMKITQKKIQLKRVWSYVVSRGEPEALIHAEVRKGGFSQRPPCTQGFYAVIAMYFCRGARVVSRRDRQVRKGLCSDREVTWRDREVRKGFTQRSTRTQSPQGYCQIRKVVQRKAKESQLPFVHIRSS